ncbi:hypothetical protein EW145_g6843 [Phellinidium pouzarii]|uniref:HMG box domain-containing protein n=1 Tax=Phellinidium pouzarii TaxID=167371 RepID=A0A4S4KV10_9AGAM|nr:hypothetical protein EW145_g6843 [Phellinidium pouzarii]
MAPTRSAKSSAKPKEKKQKNPSRNNNDSETHVPRPRNCFFVFRSDFVEWLKANYSEAYSQGNISKWCSACWHSLPKEVQAHYKARADAEEVQHKRKYPLYKFSPKKRVTEAMMKREKLESKKPQKRKASDKPHVAPPGSMQERFSVFAASVGPQVNRNYEEFPALKLPYSPDVPAYAHLQAGTYASSSNDNSPTSNPATYTRGQISTTSEIDFYQDSLASHSQSSLPQNTHNTAQEAGYSGAYSMSSSVSSYAYPHHVYNQAHQMSHPQPIPPFYTIDTFYQEVPHFDFGYPDDYSASNDGISLPAHSGYDQFHL